MGACSSTTETNEVFLTENNYDYTRHLAQYALKKDIRFIYASSAATYGNGEMGYRDDESKLHTLKPLNLYGESKQKFDLWAEGQGVLDRIVGLKYFNVFGPNEYHKEDMQSMVRKGFLQARDTNKIRLFKSYRKEYADGGQERDFLYIKDAVKMTLFFFCISRMQEGFLMLVRERPATGMTLRPPFLKQSIRSRRLNILKCPTPFVINTSITPAPK